VSRAFTRQRTTIAAWTGTDFRHRQRSSNWFVRGRCYERFTRPDPDRVRFPVVNQSHQDRPQRLDSGGSELWDGWKRVVAISASKRRQAFSVTLSPSSAFRRRSAFGPQPLTETASPPPSEFSLQQIPVFGATGDVLFDSEHFGLEKLLQDIALRSRRLTGGQRLYDSPF
jgi:hypothetical protein